MVHAHMHTDTVLHIHPFTWQPFSFIACKGFTLSKLQNTTKHIRVEYITWEYITPDVGFLSTKSFFFVLPDFKDRPDNGG